ncbi:MAG: hypothetical protein AAF567_07980 [Actinomycetota bacterium]
MATRIDIEITSDRGDGTLTWRAAGAKQPKGVVAASLLPSGATVGDILRAEAEFTVDGPELISLTTPKAPKADGIERLELLGTGGPTEGVTTQLAKKGRRDRDGRRGARGPRRDGDNRGRRNERGARRQAQIRAGRNHREAWVASLPEARRPVAEQLMHEGRDGVKEALDRQNKAAAADGRDPIDIGPIMRIADELMPGLVAAEWQDKAEAAVAAADSADLRELRKMLTQGSEHFPAEAQTQLRSKVIARVDREQAAWGREVREALTEGRTVRALQKSGRPIKAGVPLADDLVAQLCEAASAALDPDEEPHRWTVVIEALAGSPVRRLVRPTEIPSDKDDELLDTVERLAHLVPGVADAFGVQASPPKRQRTRRNNA